VLDAVTQLINRDARIPDLRPDLGVQRDRAAARAEPAPDPLQPRHGRGFIVSDHADRSPTSSARRAAGCRRASLRYREDIVRGHGERPARLHRPAPRRELRQASDPVSPIPPASSSNGNSCRAVG
jgi:hypothetical protein